MELAIMKAKFNKESASQSLVYRPPCKASLENHSKITACLKPGCSKRMSCLSCSRNGCRSLMPLNIRDGKKFKCEKSEKTKLVERLRSVNRMPCKAETHGKISLPYNDNKRNSSGDEGIPRVSREASLVTRSVKSVHFSDMIDFFSWPYCDETSFDLDHDNDNAHRFCRCQTSKDNAKTSTFN